MCAALFSSSALEAYLWLFTVESYKKDRVFAVAIVEDLYVLNFSNI